jgi:hypothetical protein
MKRLNTASLNLRAEPQVGSEASASVPYGCAREIVSPALDELRPNYGTRGDIRSARFAI